MVNQAREGGVPEVPDSGIYARIDEIVTGPDGMRWLEALYRLQAGSADQMDRGMADELVALRICRRGSAGVALTEFGSRCADSAREYIFWTERNRQLHGEGQYAVARLEKFFGKDVLEIGSGWGCNLVRLATVARRAVGLEIEPVYLEFSRILTRREGLPRPQLIRGSGENLPFRAHSFDWIVLWSVLQYTDINALFRECGRLLRPGGHILTTQLLLPRFICLQLKRAGNSRSVRPLFFMTAVVANTLWYEVFGTRLRANISGNATARPIHPTKRFLAAAAERAGLQFCPDLSAQPSDQFSLVLQKPLKSS